MAARGSAYEERLCRVWDVPSDVRSCYGLSDACRTRRGAAFANRSRLISPRTSGRNEQCYVVLGRKLDSFINHADRYGNVGGYQGMVRFVIFDKDADDWSIRLFACSDFGMEQPNR